MNELINTIRQSVATDWTAGSYPLSIVRNIQFLLYGMLLMFVAYSCKSATIPEIPKDLNLSEQKEYIKNSADIPEDKKKYILDTFTESENYCNGIIITVKELHRLLGEKDARIKELDRQAGIYRAVRNWLFGISLTAFIGFLLYAFRDTLLSIIKHLL